MKSGHRLAVGAVALFVLASSVAWAQNPPSTEEAKTAPAAIREIRILFAQGRWGQAVAALRAGEKAWPGSEDLQFMSASVAMDSGDYGTAFRLYGVLLEKYPDNAGLKNNLAWLRVKAVDPAIHDLDRALQEAQEAVMTAAHDYNVWNTLGEVYLARGDAMRAMRLAVLARDLAALAGEPDLRVYQDLVQRCEVEPAAGR